MTRPRLLPEPVGLKFVTLERPPDWDAEFGYTGPLELEIGSGAGGHALEYCRRNPGVRFVAFEWRKKYARDTQARADKAGLRNLRVIEADARFVVPRIFEANSLAVVHLQFPDPWWKRSHAKRAVIQPAFAQLLLEKLAPAAASTCAPTCRTGASPCWPSWNPWVSRTPWVQECSILMTRKRCPPPGSDATWRAGSRCTAHGW